MKHFKLKTLGIALALCSSLAFSQSAVIRGEASAGVYENLRSANNILQVNPGTGAIAAAADATANPSIFKLGTFGHLFNGTTWDRQKSAAGTIGVTAVNVEGTKTTYAAAILGLVPAATATDIFYLTGSATKTVRINKLRVTGTQTTSGIVDIALVKRSTATSGGTCAGVTTVPLDSANAAATAVATSCTANPTPGTLVGNIRVEKILIPAPAAAVSDEAFWKFGDVNGQSVVLRGTSQVAAVNLNGVTVTGGNLNISIEWTEE